MFKIPNFILKLFLRGNILKQKHNRMANNKQSLTYNKYSFTC